MGNFYSLEELNQRLEAYRDGGSTLQHGVVTVGVVVTLIRDANPHRRRIQMFNSAGAALVAYVGATEDVDEAELAAANGWPLTQAYEYTGNGDPQFKLPGNVLELHTKDAIYGIVAAATADITFIEEVD